MDYAEKQNILSSRLKASGMKVPMVRQRFPMTDGIQQKVTLKSKITDTFMNIGFMAGIENTINGNVADRLLDDYGDIFEVIKVNNIPVMKGAKDNEKSKLVDEVLSKLKEQYDFVPKDQKPSGRSRTEEPKSEKVSQTK